MDKIIVTMILVLAGVAGGLLVMNAAYPALVRSSGSLSMATQQVDDRIGSEINVIFASAELDSTGSWVDTNSNGKFDVFVWVKNVGSIRILAPERTDVFVGAPGAFTRIPYIDDAGGTYPRWTYTITNGTDWSPEKTVAIDIQYSAPLVSGTYYFKVISPTGSYDEQYFSF